MKEWIKIVGDLAPTVATALGGPYAGMAVKALKKGLFGDESCSDDELSKMLMTPEGMIHLKKIENDFLVQMEEIGLKRDQLSVEDRKSARKMAIDTTLAPQIILSALVIFGFFYFSAYVVNLPLGETQAAIVNQIIGALIMGLGMVLKFWFGGGPSDKNMQDKLHDSVPASKVKGK